MQTFFTYLTISNVVSTVLSVAGILLLIVMVGVVGDMVDRFHVRLLNFVYRIVGDRERAEDLVQEAFIRVHRHLGRFDRTKKFSTWIYTIASNLAKNELRNRARSPLVLFTTLAPQHEDEERPLEFEDHGAAPDEVFRQGHLRDAVAQSSLLVSATAFGASALLLTTTRWPSAAHTAPSWPGTGSLTFTSLVPSGFVTGTL